MLRYGKPRSCRVSPFITCTICTGGSRPRSFSASNVRQSREACNSLREIGIPYNCCGFKKAYHEHSRVLQLYSTMAKG